MIDATWAATVAVVEHDARCDSLYPVAMGPGPDSPDRYGRCDCTRNARIAKGFEAALAEYGAEVADIFSDGLVATANNAALKAFVEASR